MSKDICKGTTKKGDPCKKGSSFSGYCGQHEDQNLGTGNDAATQALLQEVFSGAQRSDRRSGGDQGGRAHRLAVSRRTGPVKPRAATTGGGTVPYVRQAHHLLADMTLHRYRRGLSLH
jgi:hypothetical protein